MELLAAVKKPTLISLVVAHGNARHGEELTGEVPEGRKTIAGAWTSGPGLVRSAGLGSRILRVGGVG